MIRLYCLGLLCGVVVSVLLVSNLSGVDAAETKAGDEAAVQDVAVSAASDCGADWVWVHRVCEEGVGDGVDDCGGGGAGGNGCVFGAEFSQTRSWPVRSSRECQ